MTLFQKMHIPLIGVIENMSFFQQTTGETVYLFGKDGGKMLAREAGIPFLGAIPIDPELCHCCDTGLTLSFSAPTLSSTAQSSWEFLSALQPPGRTYRKRHIHSFELIWKEMP